VAAIVLSPHLDDAVLSCWHLLDAPAPAAVRNVFDGAPPPGTPVAWWDRLTGAADSAARMAERRREDRSALAVAGARALGLGLLDHQYRGAPPATAALAGRLAACVPAGAVLHAPAGLAGHPDHLVVRDAAFCLAAVAGHTLVLYADLPHAILRGWPSWVTGAADAPGVGAAWGAALARAGLSGRLAPRVHSLDAAARTRKLRAVDAYATQRAALDAIAFAPLADPRTLGWEVSWAVPGSALGGADQPGGQALVPRAGCEPPQDGA
jgi:LmbE family N-acetylglucosaminyl deacetylase